MLELLLQIIGEILMQIISCFGFELCGWLSQIHSKRNPIAYALLLGIFAGALSLLFSRQHVIGNDYLRAVNLIVTPLIAGFLMKKIGDQKRG